MTTQLPLLVLDDDDGDGRSRISESWQQERSMEFAEDGLPVSVSAEAASVTRSGNGRDLCSGAEDSQS